MQGKIAVEEQFRIAETTGSESRYPGAYWAGLSAKLLDIHGARLAEMDKTGIEIEVISLNSNAVQGIPDLAKAVAVARKAFARSFKRDVRATGDLVDVTERLIERAALDALAIAHKARKVAIGFAKADTALARAPILALLSAADAAPDGVRKLTAALHRREDAGKIVVIDVFTSAQLDLALGRSNVIHAALLAGPENETFLARVDRLERFRGPPPMSGLPDIGG